jgi:hypothetical protein
VRRIGFAKKAHEETGDGSADFYSDDSYTGSEGKAPASIPSQKPRKALFLQRSRRKVAAAPNPEDPEDGRLLDQAAVGPMVLAKSSTIVDPSMTTHEVVVKMSRLDMSRDEKAGYLQRAGFLPQAISAILAQVDRYTDASEV